MHVDSVTSTVLTGFRLLEIDTCAFSSVFCDMYGDRSSLKDVLFVLLLARSAALETSGPFCGTSPRRTTCGHETLSPCLCWPCFGTACRQYWTTACAPPRLLV